MTKLVRDLVPQIILKFGRIPVFRIAELAEYKQLLRQKLSEEVEEFLESESIEEIADIIEVLEAICNSNSYKLKDILNIKKHKKDTNGAFDNKIGFCRIYKSYYIKIVKTKVLDIMMPLT